MPFKREPVRRVAAADPRSGFAMLAFAILLAGCTVAEGEPGSTTADPAILVNENFDDLDLTGRGWYDMFNPQITKNEHVPGSQGSLRMRFREGAHRPEGIPGRHLFDETEVVVLSYWVKYSSNWAGSRMRAHPHEFCLLTNKDHAFVGPARSQLTVYVEHNHDRIGGMVPMVGARGRRMWGEKRFTDDPGPRYKNDWHHIEVLLRMNSAPGVADGVVRYWLDGELIIDERDVVFRAVEAHEDMRFNQLLVAPWIGGPGSPVDQTMWIDELTISTARIER